MSKTVKNKSSEFVCKWCKKGFQKEQTLVNHLCVKKKRFMDKDTSGARFGFFVYTRFYELTTVSKKTKTVDDFIQSSYYMDFVKFGWYIYNLNPINRDMFVDWVIKSSIKLKDWAKDQTYITYLNEMVKREPVEKALERTIKLMIEWAEANDEQYYDFFRKISPNEATFFIKNGRISPWVLYLSDSANELMGSLNDEQYGMITPVIDPSAWSAIISQKIDDAKFAKNLLRESGL